MKIVKTLLLSLALSLGVSLQAQAQVAADKFIADLGEDLLTTIRNDKALQAGDMKRVNALVDDKIAPNINLTRFTQVAVGRHWRTATPEQQAALVREFRGSLLRTYGNALGAAKDAKMTVRPLRAAADDTDVVVRTQVSLPKGEPIQIDYRVEKSGNSWKIYDLNILGSWMTQTYQTQFNAEIDKNGIDGLIKSLSERNRAAR